MNDSKFTFDEKKMIEDFINDKNLKLLLLSMIFL